VVNILTNAIDFIFMIVFFVFCFALTGLMIFFIGGIYWIEFCFTKNEHRTPKFNQDNYVRR